MGFSLSLVFGLIGGLLSVLLRGKSIAVQPTDQLIWSWRSLWGSLFSKRHCIATLQFTGLIGLFFLLSSGLGNGLGSSIFFGMNRGLSDGLSLGASDGLFNGLIYGLLYWLLLGLFQGVSGKTIENQRRMVPNQGIRHSAFYGLVLGVLSAILVGLAGALSAWSGETLQIWLENWVHSALNSWFHLAQIEPSSASYNVPGTALITGICAGLLVSLLSGWLACLRHYILRFQLWRARLMPWNYVRFLDDAVECILLRKVGGGYIFLHRLLLDYFATLKKGEIISGKEREEIQADIEALRRIAITSEPQYSMLVTRFVRYLAEHGVSAWNRGSTPEQIHLKDGVRESSAVVLIASPEEHSVPALQEARNLAVIYQRPLVGMRVLFSDRNAALLPGKDTTLLGKRRGELSVDTLPGREEAAFQQVLAYMKQQWSSASHVQTTVAAKQDVRNPYKGLSPFTSDDAQDFFGREALVDQLAMSLENILTLDKRGSQHGRLLAVVGPGGVGKSSVVQAGLLPCLQSGGVFDSDEWLYLAPVIPGEHPIDSLTYTLFDRFPAKSLARGDLWDNAHSLHNYVTEFAEKNDGSKTSVVLVVDQFEEVFTLTKDEQERQCFIDLLVDACTTSQGPVIVILALRAEFYDRLEQYLALFTLIAQHHQPILPMSIDELRSTITGPALLPDVQLHYDENLVGDLLFDIQGQARVLPLLQFTLNQLFTKREGMILTQQAYHELGKVQDFLPRRAEEAYTMLPSQEHRRLARTLFLRLIDPGTSVQDAVPRRVAVSEMMSPASREAEKLQLVIKTFTDAGLLTTEKVAGNSVFAVSSTLIRMWPRLASWLNEAREDDQRISADIAVWEQRGRAKALLYRGSQLSQAQSWAARNQPGAKEEVFLRTSARQQVKTFAIWMIVLLLIGSSISTVSWLLHILPEPTLVTNLSDSGPGSLRAAIEVASPGSTITFAPGLQGTIRISQYLNFYNDVTLRGPGANLLTISAGSTASGIYVKSATVTISGLAFRDLVDTKFGFGMIDNDGGNVMLSNSIVSNNISQIGGGITNDKGTLTLNNSIVSNNIARGNSRAQEKDSFGGGIANYVHSTLIINNSIISSNTAQGTSDGRAFGGGIDNGGTLLITSSTISGNIVQGAKGDQTSDGFGGGIYNDGTALITNSTISGNIAQSNNKNRDGFGGGMVNFEGTAYITNSTLSGNIAQGMSGNDMDYSGVGGAIYNEASHIEITFCTISDNTAYNVGGGLAAYDVAGEPQSRVVLNNNLIAANNAHANGPNFAIHMFLATNYSVTGYNIVGNPPTANLIYPQPNSNHYVEQKVANVLLDTHLHNNGGPTLTLALLYGSPAIGAIPVSACHPTIHLPRIQGLHITDLHITTDQRGVSRPQGSGCSIGAYEY